MKNKAYIDGIIKKPRYYVPRYNVDLVFKLANYIKTTKKSIRIVAKEFNLPKTTVSIYVTKYLKIHDYRLHEEIQQILKHNLSEATVRGGKSTAAVCKGIKDMILDELKKNTYLKDKEYYSEITMQELGEKLKVHRRTIGKRIHELILDGKIEVIVSGRNNPSIYKLKY